MGGCWRRLLWLALLLPGCSSGPETFTAPPTSESPIVAVRPAPGTFTASSLAVTISVTAPPGAETFVGLGVPAESSEAQKFVSPLTLRLVKSTQIQVIVTQGKRFWGPYVFDYVFSRTVSGGGGCSVRPLSKYWFRGVEGVAATFDYSFPVALTTLYGVVDGAQLIKLDPTASAGNFEHVFGPLPEGKHTLGCMIRAPGLEDLKGDPVEFAVDAHAPEAAWVDPGGAFTHETWAGTFRLQTADGESGVSVARICSGGGQFCMDMLELGAGIWAYATVLTTQTSAAASLTAVITDVAGNSTAVAPLALNLTDFAEEPPLAAVPITMTTDAFLNVPQHLGLTLSEVCDLQLSAPCFDPANVPLESGWNEFLFRVPGRLEWGSVAIFRAGVQATLPPSPYEWLIYASQSVVPMMQAALIDVTTSTNDWRRAWFDVPHLYFVEDVNANLRWDEYDNFFTSPADTRSGLWMARQEPVYISPVQRTFFPQPATTTALSCPADCSFGGRLYFERRSFWSAFPDAHIDLGVTIPAQQEIPALPGDWCTFFWDENADGALAVSEPRAFGYCSAPAFALSRQDGALRFSSILQGVPYGGQVTRCLEALTPGGQILARYPATPKADRIGLGIIDGALAGDGRFPGVDSRMVFYAGDQVTWATHPQVPPTSLAVVYSAYVTDENGAPVEALVELRQYGNLVNKAVSNAMGNAQVSAGSDQPAPWFVARRDGYLSMGAGTTDSSVDLRVLSPQVTGLVRGAVFDAFGAPVPNVAIHWKAPPYESWTVSGPDGGYALPASGGDGVVTVSVLEPLLQELTFPLFVTSGLATLNVVVENRGSEYWPQGPWSSEIPTVSGGRLLAGPDYYAVSDVTGETLQVTAQGVTRNVRLPGALPAIVDYPYAYVPVDFDFAAELNLRAECGARSQVVRGWAGLDSGCWSLVGNDSLQDYYFLRFSMPATGATLLGMTRFLGRVEQAAGGTLPNQVLTFHDRLLGRRLRLPLNDGAVDGYLPLGVYQVESETGSKAIGEIEASTHYPSIVSIYFP